MLKRDELTNPISCMSRARDDEMTFVLLGRDAAAPAAIRAWITERLRLGKNTANDNQILEAEKCADTIAATTQPSFCGFHVSDGLFFERIDNGSVRMRKTRDGKIGSPVMFEAVINADVWCSVIASMSYYGEEDYGFYRAKNFHQKEPLRDSTPLKDKPAA